MSSKLYLIIWDQCYADEFDLFGYNLISEKGYHTLLEAIDEYLKNEDEPDREYEFYFGTNECWLTTYSEIKEIIKSAKLLDDSQSSVLINIFGVNAGQNFLSSIEDPLIDLGYLKWNYIDE